MKLTLKRRYYQLTYNIRMLPYNLKNYCKNLYHYRKTLWNSRPWDYQGIYLALHDQLTYMSNSIEKYGCHTGRERTIKDIRICIKLLDRLMKDDYSKFNYEWVEPKVKGEVHIKSTPMYWFPKPKGKMEFKLSESLLKQDKELLFKILNHKIRNWWD